MSSHKSDLQYMKIVNNYLNNDKFQKLNDIEHHGVTRYEHSLKVSYYSYKIAKFLRLDYKETAVGGLLHDFFDSPEERTKFDRFESVFTHPKIALETALSEFNLSRKEQDMIRSHMFPINISVPKYMESWIVSLVDKTVAVSEFSLKFKVQLKYAYNLFILFAIGLIK